MMYDRLKNLIYRSMVKANKRALRVAPVEPAAESEHARRAWDQREQSLPKTPIREEGYNIDISI